MREEGRKRLQDKTKDNRKEFIRILENEFDVKIPSFAKRWICENFMDLSGLHKWNTTKRIDIRRSYNKSIKWLIDNGVIKRSGIYPFYGYGESFEFTKKLFEHRKKIDFEKIMEKVENDLKEMNML